MAVAAERRLCLIAENKNNISRFISSKSRNIMVPCTLCAGNKMFSTLIHFTAFEMEIFYVRIMTLIKSHVTWHLFVLCNVTPRLCLCWVHWHDQTSIYNLLWKRFLSCVCSSKIIHTGHSSRRHLKLFRLNFFLRVPNVTSKNFWCQEKLLYLKHKQWKISEWRKSNEIWIVFWFVWSKTENI